MGMGARVLPAVRLSTLIHARHESTVSSSEPNEEAQPSPAAIRYPYYVSRVGMSGLSLPVYTDIRHGGSQWFTQIRKVEGDAAALCRDIFEEFGWGDPFDKANPYSQILVRISKSAGPKTVFLRTNLSREIKSWLEHRGF
ncbi:mitochondrial large ribosomal subunit [Malassezia pachydermatis]|uniref:Large ribosomal subunit protein mL49 n=1 Tax=Malassezia pachydermatis TaxID=77020 RepID=A0A0M8MTQ4_9BASI|nr:39s ribosomal protein mitochondrial [Malassezia pachydermatis]KOS14154.1 39s ribosomal protein mitochondrial [Malassezia pachydermatis]